MQKLFQSCKEMDKRCYDEYGLSEEILMEHAAEGMADIIKSKFSKGSSILIVAGQGNNGADGVVLARLLHKEYRVKLCMPFGLFEKFSSDIAKLQYNRAVKLKIDIIDEVQEADIVVDALFGAGLNRELDSETQKIVNQMNTLDGYKIACDIPTGLNRYGIAYPVAFVADTTVTMGSYKEALFGEYAKEYVGEIIRVDLGVSNILYEDGFESNAMLLEERDYNPPYRKGLIVHKGSFGHASIYCGQKSGAAIMSAMAATRFGAGLTTLVVDEPISHPPYLMSDSSLPSKTTAIAIGMGLGNHFESERLKREVIDSNIPLLLDADALSMPLLLETLKRSDREIVITPHPKEFSKMWKILSGESLSVEYIQQNRFDIARVFSQAYPDVTLLLKGANMIIARDNMLFVNHLALPVLAKGGSGDVLSGLIASLLAQGYTPLKATITASLAHTKIAQNYTGADFSLTPNDLIAGIGKL